MCRKRQPQSGKVKEVKEEVPPVEGPPSTGDVIRLVSNKGEENSQKLNVFQVTASSKKKLSCGACAYSTPCLKPSKARERIRNHREKCDIQRVSSEDNELNIVAGLSQGQQGQDPPQDL